jgi:hypothetical protein
MTNLVSSMRDRFGRPGIGLLVLLLLGISAYSMVALVGERRHSRELTTSNQALLVSLREMQNQVQSVSEKLSAMSSPAPAPPPVSSIPAVERPMRTARAVPKKAARPADDPRWRQVHTKLADQQRLIDTTREEAGQAKKELQDSLTSTRDELSGSIAKTHDEVELLQKRGERNYYEFQLNKSKQFQAAGPLSLSLRSVNVKQGHYDLALMVDDRQLQKKHVNLHEPLMFTLADRPQPVELVVNQINKNQVKGYVSEPKYKKSELAGGSVASKPASDPKSLQRR